MAEKAASKKGIFALNIILWGALWGIFEATLGYLLHSISFGYSWLVWYPAACFFMANAYRKTGRVSSIVFVGLLSAGVKLFNLLLPGRIDRVLNPAVSIVFEALSMAAVLLAARRIVEQGKSPLVKAGIALAMNTGWRLMYLLYLLFLVPDWMREISVLSSAEKFLSFFVTQNLVTGMLVFIGYLLKSRLFKPLEGLEHRIAKRFGALPKRPVVFLQAGAAAIALGTDIALQLALK